MALAFGRLAVVLLGPDQSAVCASCHLPATGKAPARPFHQRIPIGGEAFPSAGPAPAPDAPGWTGTAQSHAGAEPGHRVRSHSCQRCTPRWLVAWALDGALETTWGQLRGGRQSCGHVCRRWWHHPTKPIWIKRSSAPPDRPSAAGRGGHQIMLPRRIDPPGSDQSPRIPARPWDGLR